MQNYDLAIASDHAGFYLKSEILTHLKKKNSKMKVMDYGTHNEDSVDYPDYTKPVTDAIINDETTKGILICGTGIGMSIAANRNSDIRAALCVTSDMAEKSRQHNDANILVLGSRITDTKTALRIIDIFLETKFEGGRHASRLNKIS